jgi:hypothetical protein
MDSDTLTTLFTIHGYDDWEVIDEVTLQTPEGDWIEWDGDGSPLIEMGLI